MADFKKCFDAVMRLEGGYKLHTVRGDRGGMTYAGVARSAWPDWPGWTLIDAGDYGDALRRLIEDFYRANFWVEIKGDDIKSQCAAYMIYDFAVNAGISVSSKIAQHIVGAAEDGKIGPKTVTAINDFVKDAKDERIFALEFSLLKVIRYKDICLADKRRSADSVGSNLRFLCGWINRVQAGAKQWIS